MFYVSLRQICVLKLVSRAMYHRISANTSTAASTHGHYARRLRHCSSSHCSHRLRETFFSMRCAVCLGLTSCVCHRKRLTICIQI